MYIPFSHLGMATGMVPLPPSYFVWLVGILLADCALTQAVKGWYISGFKTWL